MKKETIVVLILYLLLFPSISITKETPSVDAYEWQQWSSQSKRAFVLGWVKCGKSANDSVPVFLRTDEEFSQSLKFGDATQEYFIDYGILLVGKLTVGQVIDTINIMYSDPRLKTTDIAKIMPLVSGRLIKGWTNQELDKVISITVQIKQCEERKKQQGSHIDCSSLWKEKNSYFHELKEK